MESITYLGLLAGALTTISLLPQVLKTWKTKSAGDISFWMFFILFVGIFCWLIYGIILNDLPLILANSISLTLNSIIIYFKLKYK